MRILLLAPFAFALSGCIVADVADTAVAVVKVPVNVVSTGVDAATTSQKEADEKRGRELRKQEEQRGRLAREMADRCRKGKALPTDDCSSVVQR
jgi:hypothetical protein